MKNYIRMLLVTVLIVILSSENYACISIGKSTSKSNKITENRRTDNQMETHEAYNIESIKRYIEWRYKIRSMRRSQKKRKKINYGET